MTSWIILNEYTEINITILIVLITVSQETFAWILMNSEPIFFILSDPLVILGNWRKIHPHVRASAKAKHPLNVAGMTLQPVLFALILCKVRSCGI